MSFILDALKKSEAERQRQAGPALLEMRIVRPARRLPTWAIVVGVVMFGCVLALTWVALRRGGSPSAAAAAAAGGATAANPAASAPAGASAGALPGAPVAAGVQAAGAPATNGAASPGNTNGAAANAPFSNAAVAPMSSGATEPPQLASAADDNPADAAPAEAPSAGLARERADTRGLRNYSELGGTMPELRLDLHVYDSKPAERYAFINMHKVREGEVTPEGVTVKEITPEGVVLEYHGTEFLLGR